MPFGPFKDFKDCVSKNQDKKNPEAYCATVHKKATGKWPTEASEADIQEAEKPFPGWGGGRPSSEALGEFIQSLIVRLQTGRTEIGAVIPIITTYLGGPIPDELMDILRRAGQTQGVIQNGATRPMVRELAEESTFATTVRGVEIFQTGTHTDSKGIVKEFSKDDLRKILDAFSAGAPPEVPVKLGHTSVEFNQQVASALGIPVEILNGENNGGIGAARLGKVIGLHLNGSLIADLELNEKVAKLIDDGFFTAVSAELQSERVQDGTTYGPVLSALALLGAQRPALADLAPLQTATKLDDGTEADSIFVHESRFQGFEGIPMEGSYYVPGGQATAPDENPEDQSLWNVILQDPSRRHFVQTSVTAASEITAKKTGLRVIENFLLSSTGPLGSILGTAVGTLFAMRIIRGQPIIKKNPFGAIRGLLRWKFEEAEANMSDFAGLLPETVMNKVQEIWNLFERGTISRDEAVSRIGEQVAQVKGKVSPGIWQQLMGAIQIIAAGFKGRKAPGEESIMDLPPQFQDAEGAKPPKDWLDRCMAKAIELKIEDPAAFCASVWSRGKPVPKESFEADNDPATLLLDSVINTWHTEYQEGIMLEKLIKLLGLSEDANEEAVFAELTRLKSGAVVNPLPNFSESDFRSMQEELNKLRLSDRIHSYEDSTRSLTTIVGTPRELATKLAALHERAGEEIATSLLSEWEAVHKVAEEKGVTRPQLSSKEAAAESFMSEVTKYQEQHTDITRAEAIKFIQKQRPDLYTEYSQAVKA